MLVVNLCGDMINVIAGIEPRAIIGIPTVGVILLTFCANERGIISTTRPSSSPFPPDKPFDQLQRIKSRLHSPNTGFGVSE